MRSPKTNRDRRQEAGVLRVTVCIAGVPPENARFVLFLDGPPEWHSLTLYVKEGDWKGWKGNFSVLPPGVQVVYCRIDEPWSIARLKADWIRA